MRRLAAVWVSSSIDRRKLAFGLPKYGINVADLPDGRRLPFYKEINMNKRKNLAMMMAVLLLGTVLSGCVLTHRRQYGQLGHPDRCRCRGRGAYLIVWQYRFTQSPALCRALYFAVR